MVLIREESKLKFFWASPTSRGGIQQQTLPLIMGIPTFIDTKHAIAHNKIMVIDKETVITGWEFDFMSRN